MARIRTIKPDAWQDPAVGRLSVEARLLWVVTITMADDEGRFNSLPTVILGHGYPYDADALSKIPNLLRELSDAGLLTLYSVDGVPYAEHPNWRAHQVINRPSASRIPSPPEPSRRAHEHLSEGSEGEGKGEEGNKEGKGREAARTGGPDAAEPETPPAALSLPDDVREACDSLAAAGLPILDRHIVAKLAADNPDIDIRAAAAAVVRWGQGKSIKHPFNALRSIVEAEDAPKRSTANARSWSGAGDLSRFDRPGVSA